MATFLGNWAVVMAVFASAITVSYAAEQPGFPQAQIDMGAAVFREKCIGCHNPDLNAGGFGPALKGAFFWNSWENKSARELYGRILSTMPANDPGSLSQREVLSLTAFILHANGYPIGDTTLKGPEDLGPIRISRAEH